MQAQMRMELSGDFVFGKKQIMRVYFRINQEKNVLYEKFQDVLSEMKGQTEKFCLFFSNKTLEEINKVLVQYNDTVYAQPGQNACATVTFSKGNEVFDSISTSNAAYIRNLGCFVVVEKGKLALQEDYLACTKGQPLKVGQSKILKMLGVKIGKFAVKVIGYML